MIKRKLRTNWVYYITSVTNHTLPELVNHTCQVKVQHPDGHLRGLQLSASVVMLDGAFQGMEMLVQGTFRLKNPSPQTTCLCRAYEWPHRLGSGKCWGLSTSNHFCGSCGKPCLVYPVSGNSQCCGVATFRDVTLEEPSI